MDARRQRREPSERAHCEESRAIYRTSRYHPMALGVFEGVLDLQRSAPLRKGAMQKLGGVCERRDSGARYAQRQYVRAAG